MRVGQRARLVVELADRLGRGEVGHVDDQRVEARPALGGVDARDGFGIGGVGGEAVDGLGRHRDRLAGQHQPRRFGDRRHRSNGMTRVSGGSAMDCPL